VISVAWQVAWQEALYGPGGFYRSSVGPSGHFSTATHGGPGQVLGAALARLARDNGLTHVVDVGAGRGELLGHLWGADLALRLTGVDVVARPQSLDGRLDAALDARLDAALDAQLDASVGWLVGPGGPGLPDELRDLDGALVVAHEWLDVVPCPVAEVDDSGALRVVLVDPATGEESLGDPVDGADLAWATAHWPTDTPGERVEIGLPRDLAWADLVSRVDHGVVVAVDYGHRGGDRPASGTLTAYRRGQQVVPVPDGSCDLTAHVAMDSLDHDELVDQRTALRGLGVDGRTPPVEVAASDPQAYLHALAWCSGAAALVSPGGFGDFLWAIKRVG
jgi:SAM-dependent MidA family methyltransferase